MASEIVMPRLGWNMEEGAVAAWHKKSGDTVTAGEILFEVESDKATQEVEAQESGILHIPQESPATGTQVPVGTLLAWLLKPGEPAPAGAARVSATPAAVRAPSASPVRPSAAPAAPPSPLPHRHRVAISPRAKRVAGELGVEWTGLHGSGSTGRIVERDVRQAAAAGTRAAASTCGAPAAAAGAATTMTTEVDATELVRVCGLLGKGTDSDDAPSSTVLLMKMAAMALAEHAPLNARWERGRPLRSTTIDISVTVDTDRGLLAPVVRAVQSKQLRQIARESADLIQRARSGHVRPQDLDGATFNVTDLGVYDIDTFTPLLPLPECAVLGVGRIKARQVVTDVEAGTVAIRRMVFLSLTFDHRLADGGTAARFLQALRRYVENPSLCLAGQ